MRKIIISLLLVLMLSAVSYGEVSGDMSGYLRVDVFTAEMRALNAKIDAFEKSVNTQFEAVNKQFEAVNKQFEALNTRINDLQTYMSWRISDTQTIVYWGLGILGILVASVAFGPSILESFKSRRPSITLDDVKRLIAESKLEPK